MHISRREAAFFHAAFQANAHRGDIENHTVNNGSWREGDLANTDELRLSTPYEHFGHADRAAADLDTQASRSHQRAPDTENEPIMLETAGNMLAVDLSDG
jgi:hypothetical protein